MGGIRVWVSTGVSAVVMVLALGPAPAGAFDGGTVARAHDGGSLAGDRRLRPALIRGFRVAPGQVRRGRAVLFALRVGGGPRRGLRARVELRPAGRRGRVIRVGLGRVRVGRRLAHRWAGSRRLRPGAYTARVLVLDRYGGRAQAARRVSPRARLSVLAPPEPKPAPAPDPSRRAPRGGGGVFPIAGPHSFGDAGSRFGADRGDHIHQGQDVSAAEGTPVVAPRPGTITVRAFQADGAGNYLVLRDADGDRDYVFMHLQDGSMTVGVGDGVRAGQRIASVGSTGSSSGPHLHFEIWEGPWQAGGSPIDPLPQLLDWGG